MHAVRAVVVDVALAVEPAHTDDHPGPAPAVDDAEPLEGHQAAAIEAGTQDRHHATGRREEPGTRREEPHSRSGCHALG
ncbi:hypothetical protein [Streptomyces sp. NPDC050804]|uniref:hypothetical protein n=1 Tax=Streptomyces sp. NPDC050804 TaxID=3154745 RepID=UPI00343E5C26